MWSREWPNRSFPFLISVLPLLCDASLLPAVRICCLSHTPPPPTEEVLRYWHQRRFSVTDTGSLSPQDCQCPPRCVHPPRLSLSSPAVCVSTIALWLSEPSAWLLLYKLDRFHFSQSHCILFPFQSSLEWSFLLLSLFIPHNHAQTHAAKYLLTRDIL